MNNSGQPSRPNPSLSTKVAGWLLVIGLLITGIGGAFAPWVWRPGVALQLTAPGLAEFVKFLPEIRTAQLQLQRHYFLLPLFLAMLALPLFVENRQLALPVWLRWGLRAAVVPLALAALSPVWTPAILTSAEFRLQTTLAMTAIGLAVIAPRLKMVPLKMLVALLGIASLGAIGLPLWQFNLARPGIEEAYHSSVSLGWGWWLTLFGLLLSLVGGVRAAFFNRSSKST